MTGLPSSTLDKYGELLRNDFVAFAHRAYLELHQREFEASWHIEARIPRMRL